MHSLPLVQVGLTSAFLVALPPSHCQGAAVFSLPFTIICSPGFLSAAKQHTLDAHSCRKVCFVCRGGWTMGDLIADDGFRAYVRGL